VVRRRATTFVAVLVTVTVALMVSVVGASASFHLMNIRQVYGGGGNAANDYVELQMRSTGENFTGGHPVEVYNAIGLLASAHPLTNVPNGANQSTILIGDSGVQGAFGVAPDVVVPGLEVSDFAMNGAVCYPDSAPPDCAAWGGFAPQGGFPDLASAGGANNFPGSIDGAMALTRRIDRGCPTLLESPADDIGPTSADFTLTAPSPRNNAMAPTERSCSSPMMKKKKCKKHKKPPGNGGAYSAKKHKCKKKHHRAVGEL
jgi:hypothetical protein